MVALPCTSKTQPENHTRVRLYLETTPVVAVPPGHRVLPRLLRTCFARLARGVANSPTGSLHRVSATHRWQHSRLLGMLARRSSWISSIQKARLQIGARLCEADLALLAVTWTRVWQINQPLGRRSPRKSGEPQRPTNAAHKKSHPRTGSTSPSRRTSVPHELDLRVMSAGDVKSALAAAPEAVRQGRR